MDKVDIKFADLPMDKPFIKLFIRHFKTQAEKPYFQLISEKWKTLANGNEVCIGMQDIHLDSYNLKASYEDCLEFARAKMKFMQACNPKIKIVTDKGLKNESR